MFFLLLPFPRTYNPPSPFSQFFQNTCDFWRLHYFYNRNFRMRHFLFTNCITILTYRCFYTRRNVSGMSRWHRFFCSCTCIKVLFTDTFHFPVSCSKQMSLFFKPNIFCVNKVTLITWLIHSPQYNLKVTWLG